MDAVHRSAAAFDEIEGYEKRFREFWEGRIEVGKTPRCSLPPVPPGRAEAVFERPALFYGEVRHREAQLRSRAAWAVTAPEGRRIRLAIAREAEGPAHLRVAGAAIPQLFLEGRARQRPNRRQP